jgi:3-hydroxybutyrate dehydrogenase
MRKTVLITGSTSGIGLAIATEFGKAGYNLIFHGLEESGADIAIETSLRYRAEHLFFNTDIKDVAGIQEMVDVSQARFGQIDVLIHAAGIQFVSPVEDLPLDKWNDLIAVHLSGAFVLARAVFPGMRRGNFGRIIHIASAHGLIASTNKSAYIAAKHGVIGLTRSLALEGAPFGITANAICPGYVLTPLVEKQIPEQMKIHGLSRAEVIDKIFLQEHAVKAFVTPEAVADLALFLADSPASPFITGAAIPIDAGWTAH